MKPLTKEQSDMIVKYLYIAETQARIAHKKYFRILTFNELISSAYFGLIYAVTHYNGTGCIEAYISIKCRFEIINDIRVMFNAKNVNGKYISQPLISFDDMILEPHSVDENIDDKIMLDEAINELPIKCLKVIRLSLKGYTLENIAEMNGYSKQYASLLIIKARKILKNKLTKD